VRTIAPRFWLGRLSGCGNFRADALVFADADGEPRRLSAITKESNRPAKAAGMALRHDAQLAASHTHRGQTIRRPAATAYFFVEYFLICLIVAWAYRTWIDYDSFLRSQWRSQTFIPI
jgi:hypothetical protein